MFPSLPSSFAPFIISLCLQSCASSSSMLPLSVSCPVLSCPVLSCPVLSCPVLSCPVLSCPVLSCPVLSCPVLSCPVLSCPVLSCPVLSCPCLASCLVFPLRGSFSFSFVYFLLIKPILLHHWVLTSSLHPQLWQDEETNSTTSWKAQGRVHFLQILISSELCL